MPSATCPNCGAALTALNLPGCPPWACLHGCERAWWEAELEHRDDWDPITRAFEDPAVQEAAEVEAAALSEGGG